MSIKQLYIEYDIADLMQNCSVEVAREVMASDFELDQETIDKLVEYHNTEMPSRQNEN